MKNIINDKLKEFVSFILCIAVLCAVGYYTGVIKGFSADDINIAYKKLTYSLSQNMKPAAERKSLFMSNRSNSVNNQSFNSYRPRIIPETVIRGAYSSNTWTNIFNSNKKVVFYIYDSGGNNKNLSPDFHEKLSNYLNIYENRKYYVLAAYTENAFKNIKTGQIGPEKICNSLQECNNQRRNASDYSNMADFFSRCSRTMCIINPRTNQYITLKSRNFGSAVSILNNLREW